MTNAAQLLLFVAGTIVTGSLALAQPVTTTARIELVPAARQFVERLVNQEFTVATQSFDEAMSKALPPEKLEEVWQGLTKAVGPFQRQGPVRTEKIDVFDIVYVTCQFERMALDAKVVFDQQQRITGLFFVPSRSTAEYKSPDYVRHDTFRETDVTVGSEPWLLPATMSMPVGGGPFPAVVLVHGSGPNDRDETVSANKPFKDLAWGLATRGIAVLRYDKRTLVHQSKMAQIQESLTVQQETIDDALAAIRLLKAHAAIDARRIFLIGHSLGGYLAPRIVSQDRDGLVAGYIVLSGNTRPLEALIWDQVNYLLRLDGSLSEDDRKRLDQLEAQMKRLQEPNLSDGPAGELVLGGSLHYWRDLSNYDPAQVAAEQSQPMLILHGQRDYQVTLEDFEGWKKALSSRDTVELKLYPQLNHLLMAGKGRSKPDEYQTPGHVAQEVVDDIANWIGRQ